MFTKVDVFNFHIKRLTFVLFSFSFLFLFFSDEKTHRAHLKRPTGHAFEKRGESFLIKSVVF